MYTYTLSCTHWTGLWTVDGQLERERGVVEAEAEQLRQQLKEASESLAGEREREREVEREREREVEREVAAMRMQWETEVQQWKKEAETARCSLETEKSSFDGQVAELCAMLERYRTENHKLVQQKDLQIHSLQSSLADSLAAQVSGYGLFDMLLFISTCTCSRYYTLLYSYSTPTINLQLYYMYIHVVDSVQFPAQL